MTDPLAHPPAAPEPEDAKNPLSQTDLGMGRVLEDLVDVLISRRAIQFTDLPLGAQAKLLERRQTRAQMSQRLNLLPDEDHNDLI
jgi:hypothetical protein